MGALCLFSIFAEQSSSSVNDQKPLFSVLSNYFQKNEKRVEAQKQNYHTPGFNPPVKKNESFVPPTKSTPIAARVSSTEYIN